MAFLLLAGFVVLNMLVGVVVENFQKCRDMIEKDRLAEKEKKKAEKLRSGVPMQFISISNKLTKHHSFLVDKQGF